MKKYLLLFLFIGTAIMFVVMAKTSATLKTPATPKGILDLEFAYNAAKTAAITNTWASGNGIDNISAAKNNTYYDFIFIFFYSLFLFFTCKKIARINFSKIGLLIAKGALWAAFLDVLENAGMFVTLFGHSNDSVALFTTICSVIKWALVVTAVLYLIAGLAQLALKKKLRLVFA